MIGFGSQNISSIRNNEILLTGSKIKPDIIYIKPTPPTNLN